MTTRALLMLAALLAAPLPAVAQDAQLATAGAKETLRTPVLRANVEIADDLVRIGDVIDNAGAAADIAIYRAPDLGTTGSLPVATVLAALRAHRVIGVDTRDIREVTVTRLARTVPAKDIERAVAEALQHRHGLGDAEDLTLTFDREIEARVLQASQTGPMQLVDERFDTRNGRFDVSFNVAGEPGVAAAKLRFTGTAIENVNTAVLLRDVGRNDPIKASDVAVERRPKAEAGSDTASRDAAVGMQARRPLRAGQVLRTADLAKPDLVQRDQGVTLIYDAAGIYLTARGKALETGAEGDVVSVLNQQSKRTVTGTVVGRGQVAVIVAPPRAFASAATTAASR